MRSGEARKETCEELLEAARKVAEKCEDVSAKVQGANEGGDHRELQHHCWQSQGAVREHDRVRAPTLWHAATFPHRLALVYHTRIANQGSGNRPRHGSSELSSRIDDSWWRQYRRLGRKTTKVSDVTWLFLPIALPR
jgi:hypothetical protein